MASLKIDNIQKVYDNGFCAVKGFSLDIKDGEFIVLVGASGCGKSTTLRMIAGLEEINCGKLFIGSKDVTHRAPSDRDIAMVFQNYALYPQMTVYENLGFALKVRKVKVRTTDGKVLKKHIHPDNIHKKVMDAAEMLGLTAQLNKKPKQLSGGQQQRVAVGRAMVREPKVFLFDEPLSNLDAKLRGEMRYEIKKLHQRLKTTMIYVTHDQIEALTLADRIIVMDKGNILQVGTPIELYQNPINSFVATFIGLPPMNMFDVTVNSDLSVSCSAFTYKPKFKKDLLKNYIGKVVTLGIRPEHIEYGKGNIDFKVNVNENLGQFSLVHGLVNDKKIICKFKGWLSFKSDDMMKIDFMDDHIHFFDKDSTLALSKNINDYNLQNIVSEGDN